MKWKTKPAEKFHSYRRENVRSRTDKHEGVGEWNKELDATLASSVCSHEDYTSSGSHTMTGGTSWMERLDIDADGEFLRLILHVVSFFFFQSSFNFIFPICCQIKVLVTPRWVTYVAPSCSLWYPFISRWTRIRSLFDIHNKSTFDHLHWKFLPIWMSAHFFFVSLPLSPTLCHTPASVTSQFFWLKHFICL